MMGGTSHQRQIIFAQEDQIGSLILLGEIRIWRTQVFLLGFSTRYKQGHGETSKVDHSVGRKKSLFWESNCWIMSRVKRIAASMKILVSFMGTGNGRRTIVSKGSLGFIMET